jgi:2-iminobutanoate/2-iminopropanoate deaminase
VSRHLKKEGIPLNPVIRAGNFVFVSGLTPMDRRTGKIPLVTVDRQARQVLDNMKVCLEAAGSSLDHVVKCNVYLRDINDFAAMNEVYQSYFSAPFPARTTIQAGALPGGIAVEIECIAKRGAQHAAPGHH